MANKETKRLKTGLLGKRAKTRGDDAYFHVSNNMDKINTGNRVSPIIRSVLPCLKPSLPNSKMAIFSQE